MHTIPTLLIITLTLLTITTLATLESATSNSQNRCPQTSAFNCAPEKVSYAIQAAECTSDSPRSPLPRNCRPLICFSQGSHNTRTSNPQTFAIFRQNPEYDEVPGAPYGSCGAYTCAAPETPGDMMEEEGCWTFFWDGRGAQAGVGTGCIRSPDSGECGCENSDGTFVEGGEGCV